MLRPSTILSLVATATVIQVCTGVTLYEYYVPGGVINSGLVTQGTKFNLNGQDITILSGSFHYFRVHPDYWRDTLKKYRAAGLNAVTMYVPWNLHEPRQGVYDFGTLGEDMSPFLNVRSFIQMAQEEDLFVIFRPGPYICSEWDLGGLPSWLLRDPLIQFRSNYGTYRLANEAYFNQLIPQVVDLEFTNGGPIIAVQVENEFGGFGWEDEPREIAYMEFLRDLLISLGFDDTLLFTSDGTANYRDLGALPGILQTSNFRQTPVENFAMLEWLQPDRPIMVTEFWTGWFDHWLADVHQDWNVEDFAATYEYMLTRGASVSMYMFIGGTNFGFMAGANAPSSWPHYAPIVTSYDYGAPLSEAGDYTEKYDRVVEILSRLNPLQGIVDNPPAPAQRIKAAYGDVSITETLPFASIVSQAPESFLSTDGPINMEALPINDGNGQAHGYILYSASVSLATGTRSLLFRDHVRDMAQVMVDGSLITPPYSGLPDVNGFGFWNGRDQSLNFTGTGTTSTLDILVENLGRVNFGSPHQYRQRKGLYEGAVEVDREEITEWTITPLEFKSSFINALINWQPFSGATGVPSMYKATFTLPSAAQDTWLDMRAWGKGVVFLNGFNLGRYWSVGPTRTLYVPAPLFSATTNEIVVFEQYEPATAVTFIDYPILGGLLSNTTQY